MYEKNARAVLNLLVKRFTLDQIPDRDVVDYKTLTSDTTIFVGALLKLRFSSLTHDLRGVACITIMNENKQKLVNFPIFVPGVLVGEMAQVVITKIKKDYAEGKVVVLNTMKLSTMRTFPVCSYIDTCGGCSIQHIKYYSQLALKQEVVANAFKKFAKLPDAEVEFPIKNETPYKYRNKVQIPFGFVDGETVCGYYKENTHEIVPLKSCYLQSDQMTEVVKYVKKLCDEFGIIGYDETTKTGDIRHLIVRQSHYCRTIMVVLVLTKEEYPQLAKFVKKLILRFPYIMAVYQNINSSDTNVILGEQSIRLFGKGYIYDRLLGNEFQISDRSFFQVNTRQAESLYRQVIKYGNFTKRDVVIDAYCGIGTIAISLAEYVRKVYGVEIVPEAIKDARKNAKLNGIKNVEFICAKAEDQIKIWQEKGLKVSAIVVDPPRKGCDKDLLTAIIEMDIRKIVYVSCDPATLARDCEYLLNNCYKIKVIQPVDLFSQTSHIETVVVLQR